MGVGIPLQGQFLSPTNAIFYTSREEVSTFPCRGSFCHQKMYFSIQVGKRCRRSLAGAVFVTKNVLFYKTREEVSTFPCRGSFCHQQLHVSIKLGKGGVEVPLQGQFLSPKIALC